MKLNTPRNQLISSILFEKPLKIWATSLFQKGACDKTIKIKRMRNTIFEETFSSWHVRIWANSCRMKRASENHIKCCFEQNSRNGNLLLHRFRGERDKMLHRWTKTKPTMECTFTRTLPQMSWSRELEAFIQHENPLLCKLRMPCSRKNSRRCFRMRCGRPTAEDLHETLTGADSKWNYLFEGHFWWTRCCIRNGRIKSKLNHKNWDTNTQVHTKYNNEIAIIDEFSISSLFIIQFTVSIRLDQNWFAEIKIKIIRIWLEDTLIIFQDVTWSSAFSKH